MTEADKLNLEIRKEVAKSYLTFINGWLDAYKNNTLTLEIVMAHFNKIKNDLEKEILLMEVETMFND